jgi:hypothetical protein
MVRGLRDVRGYDAADPARIVELVTLMADPSFPPSPPYARTQWAVPRMDLPLLNALGVRYLIGRGPPPALPNLTFNRQDYWVVENPAALPRAYVPRRAEVMNDDAERLRRLGRSDFAPAEVVFLESPGTEAGNLDDTKPFDADVRIIEDSPSVVRMEVTARTPAVIVLADQWDAGWSARMNGERVPILRANHAFRAVPVLAGKGVLEFRYEPASFRVGVRLAALSLAAQGLAIAARRLGRRRAPGRVNFQS